MPKYTINGQTINSPSELSQDDLIELSSQLGAKPPTPVTTTEQMVGLGSPIARTLKGAVANPLLALNQAGGALIGMAGEGIESVTGPNVITQGMRDVGRGSNAVVQDYEKATKEARKRVGSEGFDWLELGGAVVSPVNKLIPAGGSGVVSRGALGGVAGAVLNPVVGENLTPEQISAGKVEQAGIGAVAGRVGAKFAELLTPTLKPGVRELVAQGIPVSPGQAYEGVPGALYRQIEKLDLPFLRVNKEAINLGYTKSVGDDVLSSVGKTVPNTVKNGQQAFAYINKELNNAYDTAIKKIGTVPLDDEFKVALNSTKAALDETLDAKQAAGFNKFIRDNVVARVNAQDGTIDGADLKKLQTIFRDKIDKTSAIDTPGETLKSAYDDVYKAIKAFTLRNDADGSVAAADLGWMKQARFMEGVNTNAASARGAQGTFTPAEMAKIAAKQGGEFEAAKGIAPLQAQANKALDIVGDTTEEAQKFRTLMIAGKLTGLGALGFFSPVIALPLLTASGLSYKAAQGLMKDPGKLRLAVQDALKESPGLLGQAAANIREQLNNSGPNTRVAPPTPGQPEQPQQPRSFLNNVYPKLGSTVVGTAGRFDANHPIAEQIRAEADRQGMSEFKDLLVRQAFQESKFNPDARSNKKAGGVMQIIPGTAKELGVKNVFDAADNIRGGVKYMKQLLEKYDNDPEKALAAYNWGQGRVDKFGLSRMPLETKGYITNILGKDI
jgi:hypothetical protein